MLKTTYTVLCVDDRHYWTKGRFDEYNLGDESCFDK